MREGGNEAIACVRSGEGLQRARSDILQVRRLQVYNVILPTTWAKRSNEAIWRAGNPGRVKVMVRVILTFGG